MCLNKKVIAGVAVAAVAVWLLAPNLIGAALPLLVLAVCPLSMIVMMKAMSGNNSKGEPRSGSDTDVDAELARLRKEVADLRGAGQAEAPTSAAPADRV